MAGEKVIIRPMSPKMVFVQLDDLKTLNSLNVPQRRRLCAGYRSD